MSPPSQPKVLLGEGSGNSADPVLTLVPVTLWSILVPSPTNLMGLLAGSPSPLMVAPSWLRPQHGAEGTSREGTYLRLVRYVSEPV